MEEEKNKKIQGFYLLNRNNSFERTKTDIPEPRPSGQRTEAPPQVLIRKLALLTVLSRPTSETFSTHTGTRFTTTL